jgi:hypothetical protein
MGVAKVNMDWIGRFMGEWVPFEDLNEIPISEDEVVIAIGLWTVSDVVNLRKRCIRCRYNHGLRPDLPEAMKNAYKFSMPTLAGCPIPCPQFTGTVWRKNNPRCTQWTLHRGILCDRHPPGWNRFPLRFGHAERIIHCRIAAAENRAEVARRSVVSLWFWEATS